MPGSPAKAYAHDGWKGWDDWLGIGNAGAANGQHPVSFEQALVYARSLELNSVDEWDTWCVSAVRPANIPCNPQRAYAHDGWQGWSHWLNLNSNIHQHTAPARTLAPSPGNVPIPRPDSDSASTRDGWQGYGQGYGHWLGNRSLMHKGQSAIGYQHGQATIWV